MIVADTDVLIDFLARVQPATHQVAEYIAADQLQPTAVNYFELLSRAGENKRGLAVRQLLESLSVLQLDRAAAEHAADVRRKLERTGRKIGMGDTLIAGIALAHDMPLLTRNKSHFERVENLKFA